MDQADEGFYAEYSDVSEQVCQAGEEVDPFSPTELPPSYLENPVTIPPNPVPTGLDVPPLNDQVEVDPTADPVADTIPPPAESEGGALETIEGWGSEALEGIEAAGPEILEGVEAAGPELLEAAPLLLL
jgi:hypothetical protein